MAVNVYGLTASDVQDAELAFMPDVDSSLLAENITRAAAELNVELRAFAIDPAQITAATYPDDYEWCRSTVLFGAAGMYLRTVTGAEQAATAKLDFFARRIAAFVRRPQMLAIYSAVASSALIARSPANYGDTTANTRARARFVDPSRVDRWRQ